MKCPRCEKEMEFVFEINAGCQKVYLKPDGAVETWAENEVQEGKELLCGNCFEEIGWIENDQVVLYDSDAAASGGPAHCPDCGKPWSEHGLEGCSK